MIFEHFEQLSIFLRILSREEAVMYFMYFQALQGQQSCNDIFFVLESPWFFSSPGL